MPEETTTRPLHVAGLTCEPGSTAGYLLRPLTILRAYRRDYLRPDLLAGLTVAAVAIPQAIAYASIAELPPHYGLYTAAIGAIVGSLWGNKYRGLIDEIAYYDTALGDTQIANRFQLLETPRY